MNKEIEEKIEDDVSQEVIQEQENKKVNYSDFKDWKIKNYYQLLHDYLETFDNEISEENMDKEDFEKYSIEIYNEIGGY